MIIFYYLFQADNDHCVLLYNMHQYVSICDDALLYYFICPVIIFYKVLLCDISLGDHVSSRNY